MVIERLANIMSAISYNKLFKLLIDKGITKTELRTLAGVSSNVIAKMGKGDSVTMDTLARICMALNCDVGDIVEVKNSGKV